MVSVACWTLWKHRNNICFTGAPCKNNISLLFLIISLLNYWLGNVKEKIVHVTQAWLPDDLESIPLQEMATGAAYLTIGEEDEGLYGEEV